MDYLYDAIFKMAASEVKLHFRFRRNRCLRWRKTTTGRRRCSPWWTVSSGTRRGQRNHLYLRSYNRCLHLRVAWAMRCDRSLAVLTLLDGRLNIVHHFDHATIPGLNVLAVASWDTHKFVAPNQTHLFRSGRVDGWIDWMDHNDAMTDPHRETRYRLGPNPHWHVYH